MEAVFRDGQRFCGGKLLREDLCLSGEKIVSGLTPGDGRSQFDLHSLTILPGFADVHVHLREPGYSYKETIRSGTMAAVRGGYTAVCPMPNLDPAPDTPEALAVEQRAIRRGAVCQVFPYGCITMGEKGESLSDMDGLSKAGVIAFSDDGHGVQSENLMRSAMEMARRLGKLIVAHCEDNALLRGGYIHDGAYAKARGHRGICSESEWGQIKRDLALAKETGCAYHVCHISAKESVALIRQAKKEGVNVSCETAPHYLLLDDSLLQEDGRFKMNPPLRDKSDREALLEGILDGTIDCIATDHAPHSAEEKNRGLEKSLMGIVGLETAFPLLYTYLVKSGTLSLERLMELLVYAPRRRFSLGAIPLEPDGPADFSVWDLNVDTVIDPAEFLSKGRATPFEGWAVSARCKMTVAGGKIAWDDGSIFRT